MMKKQLMAIAIAATAAFASGSANAAFIEGGLSFAGQGSPTPAATPWGAATGVTFGNSIVTSVTPGGSYAAVAFATPVNFTSFTFSPALSPSPVDPLWSFSSGGSTFSFTLTSLQVIAQTGDFLNLSGEGTLKATGLEDTKGYWQFTGQGPIGNFSVSSSSGAVPLPGTLALLGLGLFGAAGVTRRVVKAA